MTAPRTSSTMSLNQFLLLLVLALLLTFAARPLLFAGDRLPVAEVVPRIAAGTAVLVDVREPDEWATTGVVASAYTLALSDLLGERMEWKAFLAQHRDKEIILYCRSGARSGRAAQVLAAEGFTTANAGGLRDWLRAGQPVRKPEEPPATQPSTAP